MKKYFFLVAIIFCGGVFLSAENVLAGSCGNYRGTCKTNCASGETHSTMYDEKDCNTSMGEMCCLGTVSSDCKNDSGVCRDTCNSNETSLGSGYSECAGLFGNKQCCGPYVPGTAETKVLKNQGDYCAGDGDCKPGLICDGIFFKTCESGAAPPAGSSNSENPAPAPRSSGTGAPAAQGSGGWNLADISGFGLPKASVSNITGNLLNWLLGILATAGVIGFVISGIIYLISTGDETTIDRAKEAMKWSLVGIIVGLSGVIIIQAVDWALNGFGGF